MNSPARSPSGPTYTQLGSAPGPRGILIILFKICFELLVFTFCIIYYVYAFFSSIKMEVSYLKWLETQNLF